MSPRQLFKERQSIGWAQAIHNFYQRRHIMLLAYLVLAGFTIYAFALERQHSNQNRHELATQTHTVLVKGCERQNVLRLTLQQLLKDSQRATKTQFRAGKIPKDQYKFAQQFYQKQIVRLNPTDCAKVYPVPKG